jgi:predicted ATPase
MLKRLRLKNWRSLRDVEINFAPITVFIGANSSGKTNILDALHFIRDTHDEGIMKAVYSRGFGEKIRTLGTSVDTPVTIEYQIQVPDHGIITHREEMRFSEHRFQFHVKQTLLEGEKTIYDEPYTPLPPTDLKSPQFGDNNIANLSKELHTSIVSQWQLLDENFLPPLVTGTTTKSDLYMIDSDAENLVFMLDFMKDTNPALYGELLDDFRYLLGHIKQVSTIRDERETRISINETNNSDKEAPTISAGTARILAVLTAVYALDMRNANTPGLVVIEEPETSLNPSLLKNFVELLRGYTTNKQRQFILTTHNPAFLNYFQPEEVRVVARDMNGDTTVTPVPEYIKDIWLDEYDLGEVWLTNAFGGVVE